MHAILVTARHSTHTVAAMRTPGHAFAGYVTLSRTSKYSSSAR